MIDQGEIHVQCFNKNPKERIKALDLLKANFSLLPHKQQAWNDFIILMTDEDHLVRSKAFSVLGSVFSDMPDKQRVWNDLVKLTNDEDSGMRYMVASALGSVFTNVPDKKQAWNNLIKLTNDKDSYVRSRVAYALAFVFSNVPDKQQAWNDLIKLTTNKYSLVRYWAAYAINSVFSQVPDTQKAWNDLHRLANSEDSIVRYGVTSSFSSSFYYVPDKQQAWNDFIILMTDKDSDVRYRAYSVLDSVFSNVPDRQQAWNDLIKLTTNEYCSVRYRVTYALGFVFSNVPNKHQAWNDLIKLTTNEYLSVRIYANHSLGRVSIYMASQAEKEEEYKRELETAIAFFEIAAQESSKEWGIFNPSQFCLPFYRSFYSIIFKRQEAKGEVDKYLVEAKDAIEGSKSKELIFEAVENLANALKEVQNLGNLDLEAKKGELSFYRKYCNRAEEIMRDAEEATPFAITAMRKGLPILDRNLKELLEEIQKKAKIACKESKGTGVEETVCEINKEIQNAINYDQGQFIEILEDVISILKVKIPSIPENKYIFSKIEALDNKTISPEKYRDLPLIVSLMSSMKVVSAQELDHKLQKLDLVYDKTVSIEDKLVSEQLNYATLYL